jgi:hypothetical protein
VVRRLSASWEPAGKRVSTVAFSAGVRVLVIGAGGMEDTNRVWNMVRAVGGFAGGCGCMVNREGLADRCARQALYQGV